MSRRFDDRSRKLARERYWDEHDKTRYTCPDCGRGRDEIVGEFQVHHKSGNPHDNRLEHLVGLCGFCHRLREDKKPSLERIRAFRDSGASRRGREVSGAVSAFIDERVCLCSEGRAHEWVDPIRVWFSAFEGFCEDRGLRVSKDLFNELVFALIDGPETSLEFHNGGVMVIGPDPHGTRGCDCFTAEDVSAEHAGWWR